MLVYPATFQQEKDYIVVRFPDIPEAMTQGKDLAQAYEMAKEVLCLALEGYSDYPQATSIKEVQQDHPEKSVALISIGLTSSHKKARSQLDRLVQQSMTEYQELYQKLVDK